MHRALAPLVPALALLVSGCSPAVKTASNDIAQASAAACEEAAQQPNDPAWVALACLIVNDVNQVIQAAPARADLASQAAAPRRLVVIPRKQWEEMKAEAAARTSPASSAR